MSNTEFKARALYNFIAEGPNELSFNANEILTITSNTAGHGWWYAKNSKGNVGVIPENYVQALADPPEPNEPPPPPPPISLFSNSNNNYLNSDFSRTSTHSNYSPDYDEHRYMNPATYMNRQAQDSIARPSSQTNSTRQTTKGESDSDSFSDSEYPNAPSSNSNIRPKQHALKRTNTIPSTSTLSSQARTSLANVEVAKPAPRARFFDKHGLDNYLLNGSKTKPEEHAEIAFNEKVGVHWSPNPGLPPFSCTVEDPSKGTKLGGLKAFIEYKIHPQIPGSRVVGRRYKQFDWLHDQLVSKFRFICIPPLPEKQIAGRFEQEFVEERRRQLELWLNRVCRHPVLCASFPVQHFIACELTEKNKKDWKSGKRRVEKDESRDAPWLQCVSLINTGLSESEIVSLIEVFAQQQPGLEMQLKNLSQGLSRYLERHSEVYERDIQRISDLFLKVHQVFHVDTTTPGNKELSNSIHKISGSYGNIAESYKTQAVDGLRDFNERIQEYIGLLGCFPSILNIQRSASEFIKTCKQRGTADIDNAIHRNLTLIHVVLAEINFFQKEKVDDFNIYLKTFVNEQTKFYEKITSELHDASIILK